MMRIMLVLSAVGWSAMALAMLVVDYKPDEMTSGLGFLSAACFALGSALNES